MASDLDLLLKGLPKGDPQYVRNHDTGMWDVHIFAPNTIRSLAMVAANMDKNVALWMMQKIKKAFERIY